MIENRASHTFEVAQRAYWEMWCFDEAYRRAYCDFMRLDILDLNVSRDGDRVTRTLVFKPHRKMPAFLAKLLAGASRVTDTSVVDLAAGTCDVTVQLPVIGKRTSLTGRYTSEALDDGRLKRDWHGQCASRIPLIGGRIEKFVLAEMEQTFVKDAQFTARWISQR